MEDRGNVSTLHCNLSMNEPYCIAYMVLYRRFRSFQSGGPSLNKCSAECCDRLGVGRENTGWVLEEKIHV
jgi:hypothetical protein